MRLIASISSGRVLRAATFVAVAVALLSGCQSPVRLMPSPIKFTSSEIDFVADKHPDQFSPDMRVFYATNRAVLIGGPDPIHTIFPADNLRLGVAHVRVGDGSMSPDEMRALSTSTDGRRRPALNLARMEQLAVLAPDAAVEDSPDALAYFAQINAALSRSASKGLIIYVHGANNPVWRGTAQAAQFQHFNGGGAVVLSFLWPSAGSILSYATDVRHTRASIPAFVRLVEMLARHTDAQKIDILAYSAGAQIVSPALAILATPRADESRTELRARLRLGSIYFAAPDEDTRRFADHLAQYADATSRVTVAANLNDSVLGWAARHHGTSRAGRPDPDELDEGQTQFLIDASNRRNCDLLKVDPQTLPGLGRRSHNFWMSHPWVSTDVLIMFRRDAAPLDRALVPNEMPRGTRFWTFGPDYEDRIRAVLRMSVEAATAPQ